jgi:ketosteroid isomerase-like protein
LTSHTDVVRRFYAAFPERDLAALLDTLDPGIEFEPILGVLYSQHVYRGHAEMRRWCEETAAQWESFETAVENIVEVGDGVTVFLHLTARRGDERLEADIAAECAFAGNRLSRVTGRDAWEAAAELGVAPPRDRVR